MKFWTVALVLLWVTVNISGAVVHYVNAGQSIQFAVDTASDGDTIVITEGTYMETTLITGRVLTIGSESLIDGDTAHVANTVIQPDSLRPDTMSCFVFANCLSARLAGVRLTNGSGTLWAESDYVAGGAVLVYNSHVYLEQCIVAASSAELGGGVAAIGDGGSTASSVEVSNCTIVDCIAQNWGGGFYALQPDVAFQQCQFVHNSALTGSGAADIIVGGTSVFLDCEFRENSGWHGGITQGSGTISVINCSFLDNDCSSGLGPTDLDIFDCVATISRCHFQASPSLRPAVVLSGGNADPMIEFLGNVVENHESIVLTGTVLVHECMNGEFAYNIFRNNANTAGGALLLFGERTVPRIHHNYFAFNSSPDSTGSAIRCVPQAFPTLDSNWFVGNTGNSISTWEELSAHGRIHAEDNWWGSASGPYHPVWNPAGQGDTVLQDCVYVAPWLIEPPDTSMPQQVVDRGNPMLPRTWELLSLYPNPFNASLRMILVGFTGSDFEICLYNLAGQKVDVVQRGATAGGEVVYRASPTLASGVYFVVASDRSSVQTRKVVLLK